MKATVIVCTYNRASSLERMLASLRASVVSPDLLWEVIVVDNNSRDDTRGVVERAARGFPCPVRYLFEGRQGKSHALNLAISKAGGEYLLFTDDDVLVDPGWVQAVVDGFAAHDCMGIGGRIEAVWNRERPRWYSNTGPHRLFGAIVEFDFGDEIRPVPSPPFGANMAFRREAFTRYGFFRTDLGAAGKTRVLGEDTDLARRVMQRGERVLYLPTALILHPVEEERVRKRYFIRWYFNYGVCAVRVAPEMAVTGVAYFGVPRHIYRSLASTGLRWLFGLGAKYRFYHALQFCHHLGELVEVRRINRQLTGRHRLKVQLESEPGQVATSASAEGPAPAPLKEPEKVTAVHSGG